MFMEVLGVPDNDFIDKCPRKKVFFESNNKPKIQANSRGKVRNPSTKSVNYYLRSNDNKFINFVNNCFTWNDKERMTPSEALIDDWILEGLPEDIRS